jgi:hypothetical protein
MIDDFTAAHISVPGNRHIFDLAERGFHVFPLIPGTKRPMIRDWENRATTAPEALDAWPKGAGVGIACGPSNLVMLDLDAHGGEPPAQWAKPGIRDGLDVLAAVWAEHDLATSFLHTLTVRTPSSGLHCYFRAPDRDVRNSAGRIGWQVDVRAQGGYVVGPGTVIEAGTYEATHTPQELMTLPGWLADLLLSHTPAERPQYRPIKTRTDGDRRVVGLARAVAEAGEGQRNSTLNWAAYQLAQDGILTREYAQALHSAAVEAGLPEDEIVRTIQSAAKGVAA